MNTLLLILGCAVGLLLFILLVRAIMYWWNTGFNSVNDFETVTTTTTTTTNNDPSLVHYDIVGTLSIQRSEHQPFVIDPVDGKKWFLNTNDDMFEDAAGKIWKLV